MKMTTYSNWKYDEFKQIGTDYRKQDEVDIYDLNHAEFLNFDTECDSVLELLDLNSDDALIDFLAIFTRPATAGVIVSSLSLHDLPDILEGHSSIAHARDV